MTGLGVPERGKKGQRGGINGNPRHRAVVPRSGGGNRPPACWWKDPRVAAPTLSLYAGAPDGSQPSPKSAGPAQESSSPGQAAQKVLL